MQKGQLCSSQGRHKWVFDIKTFMVWFGSSTSERRDDELSRININKCFELSILSEFTRAGQKEVNYWEIPCWKKNVSNFLLQWPIQFNLCYLSWVLLIVCCQNCSWGAQRRLKPSSSLAFQALPAPIHLFLAAISQSVLCGGKLYSLFLLSPRGDSPPGRNPWKL